MQNEILSEVWQNRDEFAKRYNYDLNAMVAILQKMENHPWSAIVDRRKETPIKKNEPDRVGCFYH
ncbi:hypothetical protein AUJ95_04750 [Candidatus Desantisbacteria bacterium CG2_30_40_21]|uniref:Uncharacterized protein n=2 Tax=unclassified Candidatus Desantisiibacteriota TaxID=3106372 RepID=A0A2M7P563_9BACT|nr:MAG: hypothetical protein AUJ95_04750 [Candidatus Desantisbacteria bacterium CG2_30_40_21]PIY20519.1 MAG: hypothetical protein COZ13_00495 [Candidatus Desantisbacteria bacterium CG_4_10_14_3_um_filter_40_18]